MYAKQVLLASFNYLKQKINILNVRAKNGRQDKMKATGRDGIPVELFQILKDDAVKVLHNMLADLENSSVATRLEKVTFPSNPKERQCQGMLKLQLSCSQ